MTVVLETVDLCVSFGKQLAVDHVSFQLRNGELTSIIGPNGAGKTTFFNLISGQLTPTNGDVYLNGNKITSYSPTKRARLGIGRSFQMTNVFLNLTVFENIRLAVQSQQKVYYTFWKRTNQLKNINEKTNKILAQVLLENKREMIVSQLSHGEKRKLEIGMLLALETNILLLDEPTAGMAIEEVPMMIDVIKEIKKDKNKTILLIEHKMDMVLDLSDRMIVLVNGAMIADGTPTEIMADEIVQTAYLGGGSFAS
ncbi:MAG: ABC transporter ATP-binding protein [Bacillaceae bacterium]